MATVPAVTGLTAPLQRRLLEVAREAIEHGLVDGASWLPGLEGVPEALSVQGASFVTLYTVRSEEKTLRGCIGSLEPRRPLLQDVAHNAFYSAFGDRRFAPVTKDELTDIELELSVLSPLVALRFNDEADLLRQLVVPEDGIAIEWGDCRATFLPSVWEQLPVVKDFWTQLKRKAGLSADFWHPELRCWRYRVLKIREADFNQS